MLRLKSMYLLVAEVEKSLSGGLSLFYFGLGLPCFYDGLVFHCSSSLHGLAYDSYIKSCEKDVITHFLLWYL